jgi:hypothetical protein
MAARCCYASAFHSSLLEQDSHMKTGLLAAACAYFVDPRAVVPPVANPKTAAAVLPLDRPLSLDPAPTASSAPGEPNLPLTRTDHRPAITLEAIARQAEANLHDAEAQISSAVPAQSPASPELVELLRNQLNAHAMKAFTRYREASPTRPSPAVFHLTGEDLLEAPRDRGPGRDLLSHVTLEEIARQAEIEHRNSAAQLSTALDQLNQTEVSPETNCRTDCAIERTPM